jgi:hypothetical protein
MLPNGISTVDSSNAQFNSKMSELKEAFPCTSVSLCISLLTIPLFTYYCSGVCNYVSGTFKNVFEQNKVTTGTPILLSKKGKEKHSAFYLGKELYMSLSGTNGPIIVTHLQEMKNFFDAEDVQILEPKND